MRREYVILKNGIVVYRQIEGRTQRVVSILCEESEARMLLTAARSLDLPAASEIRSVLFPYRQMG